MRDETVPKQVDHEARRKQIADAVCRLAGRQGLAAVSLRHVAAEAGVSMGLVQHYFTSKDQMLLFAFKTLGKRVEQRIAESAAALPEPPTPRSLLRALLTEMLPLTEQSRTESPVWIAFAARAVVAPDLAAHIHEDAAALREFVAGQIRYAQETGQTLPDVDPEREAIALLAFVDGLMMHTLVDEYSPQTAQATLDYRLDRIFTTAAGQG